VLPISAWVAGRVGRKRFYMTCVALFTVSSFLCGLAPSLPALVAFLSTMLARRSQTLQSILAGHLSQSNPVLQERLAELQRAFASAGLAQAMRRASAAVYGTIQQQSVLLGYVSIIRDPAIACAILVPLILLLVKRNQPGAAAMGGH
jgi:MFS family permease